MWPSTQTHPFCRFSEQVRQSAEDALQGLKNRHELNADVILFCYWFAANNQGLLSKAYIKRLLAAIYTWHHKIVLSLQALCAQLENAVALDLWTLEDSAHAEASATLFTAEQIEQLLIADALPQRARRARASATQTARHACVNVATYCQSVYVTLDEADYIRLSLITAAAFPEMDAKKSLALVHNALAERQVKQPLQKNLPLFGAE